MSKVIQFIKTVVFQPGVKGSPWWVLLLMAIAPALAHAEGTDLCGHGMDCSLIKASPAVFASDRTKEETTQGLTKPIIRMMYMIPSNREPQPHGVAMMQYWLLNTRDFFRTQMEINGFGPMTFEYETESDGVTPKVNVVYSARTDETFRLNPPAFIPIEAGRAGFPLYQDGEIWIVICEMHEMHSDGRLSGNYNAGYNNIVASGEADAGGSAVAGSAVLPFLRPELLLDTRTYHGMTLPELGPYPMVYDVTVMKFEGRTLSDLASSFSGAMVHELGHALGLFWHDFRMDDNFHGNLMGNGFRGIRSCEYPEQFPEDQTRLGWDQALYLSNSPYFRRDKSERGHGVPTAQVLESSKGNVKDGQLVITFDATDNDGPLAAAFLLRGFEMVDSMKLKGSDGRWEFRTPYFEPGKKESWTLYVQDVDGNMARKWFSITPDPDAQRAPIPRFRVDRLRVMANQAIMLDAQSSYDPDETPGSLSYEWDLDGDEQVDLGPDNTKDTKISYSASGLGSLRLRVTDQDGNSAWSPRVGIQVLEPAVNAAEHWNDYR